MNFIVLFISVLCFSFPTSTSTFVSRFRLLMIIPANAERETNVASISRRMSSVVK